MTSDVQPTASAPNEPAPRLDAIELHRRVVEIERQLQDIFYRSAALDPDGLLTADLRHCESALAQAHKALQSPPTSERTLVHDLRNQLGMVQGYAELMQEEHGAEIGHPAREALYDLERSAETALELMNRQAVRDNTPPRRSRKRTQTTETGRVLVIDDSRQSRELLSRFLRRKGHSVLTAASGAQALELLGQHTVDLALLDLQMPEMDGMAVLGAIKSDPELRALPVIIVSGMQDTDEVVACIDAGAEDYLYKPFNATMLQARLNACLQRKQWHDREQAYRRELERNQRFIRNTFGRYLSDEIVDALLESPTGLNIGGSKRTVTILMADIRNFTTISEKSDPERIVELLNSYLGRMSEIIMAHNGTVDEFIGDAILAIFGAPVSRPDDAERAVRCALEMQAAVSALNTDHRGRDLPEIGIGIGLNTGEVVAGNIGSERRSKYAVVGHTVNLTARIESYTVAGEVLASESTLASITVPVEIERQFSKKPKGMAEPVRVYALTGIAAAATAQEPN